MLFFFFFFFSTVAAAKYFSTPVGSPTAHKLQIPVPNLLQSRPYRATHSAEKDALALSAHVSFMEST